MKCINLGATNIKIDSKSKEKFRQVNGISHRRRTMDALVDEPVSSILFYIFQDNFTNI